MERWNKRGTVFPGGLKILLRMCIGMKCGVRLAKLIAGVDSTSYFERLHETEQTDYNAENDNFIYINGVHRVIFRL